MALRAEGPRPSTSIPVALERTPTARLSIVEQREVLANLLEAQVLVEEHRPHYNRERLRSVMGNRTSAGFAASACEEPSGTDKGLT